MHAILLQAQQGSQWTSMIFMVAIVAVFYLFMIRPQQKKAKEQKKFTEEIQKGDYVVTLGGMHGRVAELEGETFVLEVERGARIRMSKSAVSMESTKAMANKK